MTIEAKAEPAGPRQTAPASPAREAINTEVPLQAPKKRTGRDVIEEIRTTLAAAETVDEVVTIGASDLVLKAQAWLKNGALDELNGILAAAFERAKVNADDAEESESAEDGAAFPGDLPVTDEMLEQAHNP